ncbi:MAG: ATP-binding protein, partial [Anaerolineales bacterium]
LHPEEDLRPERLLETGWSGEVTLHRRNGTEFPAYLSLRPVHSEVAARSALAGTIHDLTQVKRQQASLRAAYEQVATARRELEALNAELEERVAEKTHNLSEANKQLARQNEELQTLDGLKSEFVSLVSHELRAPLTTVSGGIELLLADPAELSSPVRDTLSLVQAHIQRLTQFVETILDLSALETGRLPVYPEVWDVSKIIQTIRDQFVASQVGKRLTLRLPPSLPPVLADERGLTSVIFHLIDNAIKYAPEGEVTLEAEDGGEWVRVHVSDQGPGIPPEAREKIFEKFERLDSQDSRSVYGHGLGLYMSRRLLQAMGGDIVAGEAPGGGARFTFWLPVVKEEKDHDQ